LAYNVFAVISLVPIVWLIYSTESHWVWQWRGKWAWVSDGAALTSVLCFFVSAKFYDLNEFFGFRQLADRGKDTQENFTISPFHRFVRHPWYCFGLVLIWTRDMNEPLLISGIAITVYFVIGSRLEEKKLIDCFGDSYRRYIAAVPGLIPLPWRYLSSMDAATLVNKISHM